MAETRVALIERMVKERDKMGKVIAEDVKALAKKINDLTKHDLFLYENLFKPDCLYGDSPLGRAFTQEYLKQWMIKNDMDFVGYFLDGKVNIRDFIDRVQDASRWAMKWTKEPEKEKTGIEAIL